MPHCFLRSLYSLLTQRLRGLECLLADVCHGREAEPRGLRELGSDVHTNRSEADHLLGHIGVPQGFCRRRHLSEPMLTLVLVLLVLLCAHLLVVGMSRCEEPLVQQGHANARDERAIHPSTQTRRVHAAVYAMLAERDAQDRQRVEVGEEGARCELKSLSVAPLTER